MALPVNPYVPLSWSEPYMVNNPLMDTPPTYVKFLIDIAKVLGYIDGGLPDQTGNANKFLSTDGMYPFWADVPSGGGTVTSVGISIPSSALSISNSPIISSGVIHFDWIGYSSEYVMGDGSLKPGLVLTTTGTGGVSTYNSLTNVLNIPNYAGGSTSSVVIKEIPAGVIDGINTIYTLSTPAVLDTEYVYLNGQLLDYGDYTFSGGDTITFLLAPKTGWKLVVEFSPVSGGSSYTQKQIPIGPINGSNATFTIPFPSTLSDENVFLNGQLLSNGDDYSISGATLTLFDAPKIGWKLLISYI